MENIVAENNKLIEQDDRLGRQILIDFLFNFFQIKEVDYGRELY